MASLAHAALIKDRGIIGQIIQPTYFEDAYPIDWKTTNIYNFSDLVNEPDAVTNSS